MPRKKTATEKEKQKINEVVEVVQEASKELMLKKREELPKYIEERTKKFLQELEEYKILKQERDEAQIGSKTLHLQEFCFHPFIKQAGTVATYSAAEYSIMFDYFRTCVIEMNKVEPMPPSFDMFAMLCGMSRQRLNEFRRTGDSETREILEQVHDWILSFVLQGSLTRKFSEPTGIFVNKEGGRQENLPQQQAQTINNITIGDDSYRELCEKFNVKLPKP